MHALTIVNGLLPHSAASSVAGFPLLPLIFLAMTAICAASFIGAAKQRRWQRVSPARTWAAPGRTVPHHLP